VLKSRGRQDEKLTQCSIPHAFRSHPDTAITGTSMSVETRELAHSPIPIFRAGTPPVQARQAPGFCSTSPGAFYKIITPPMNSPRGTIDRLALGMSAESEFLGPSGTSRSPSSPRPRKERL
jgi:hypothetical protein